jgi:hypothetical protein
MRRLTNYEYSMQLAARKLIEKKSAANTGQAMTEILTQ